MEEGATKNAQFEFRIGDWKVVARENLLKGAQGNRVLEPKVMDLLVFLASRPGEVVSRQELLERVWADVVVGDEALSRAISVLRAQLGDDPKDPRYLRTVAKRGYQLVADVDPPPRAGGPVAECAPDPTKTAGAGDRFGLSSPYGRRLVIGTAIVGVASAILLSILARPLDTNPPQRKMIVVLPFENLGSPEDEYFAEGMTDEITSRLSKVRGLGVISRNSALQYGGNQETAKIGEELGVGYLLGGTVRWAQRADGGSRLRVTPRLVRVADDTVMWSEVYDRVLDDIFAIQSGIAVSVVRQLGLRMEGLDSSTIENQPTANLEAYRSYLRVRSELVEDCARLRNAYLDRAVNLDPSFLLAWTKMASWHSNMIRACPGRAEHHETEARKALDRALQLDPTATETIAEAARLAMKTGDYEGALTWIETARDHLESNSWLLERKAAILRRQGRWQEAIEHYEKAIVLDPRSGWLAHTVALSHTWVRDFPAALAQFDRAIALGSLVDNYQLKAELFWLWNGDTASARKVLESAPEELRDAAQIRWAWYWQEIYEGNFDAALEALAVLPSDALRTPLHAWPKALHEAVALDLLNQPARARESYEAARRILETRVEAAPGDGRAHRALAIALASLGHRDAALAQNRLAQEIYPLAAHPFFGTINLHNLALVFTLTGDYGSAFEQLELLLARPAMLTIPLLQLDPRWAPLRDDPRFETLERQGTGISAATGPSSSTRFSAQRSEGALDPLQLALVRLRAGGFSEHSRARL